MGDQLGTHGTHFTALLFQRANPCFRYKHSALNPISSQNTIEVGANCLTCINCFNYYSESRCKGVMVILLQAIPTLAVCGTSCIRLIVVHDSARFVKLHVWKHVHSKVCCMFYQVHTKDPWFEATRRRNTPRSTRTVLLHVFTAAFTRV